MRGLKMWLHCLFGMLRGCYRIDNTVRGKIVATYCSCGYKPSGSLRAWRLK